MQTFSFGSIAIQQAMQQGMLDVAAVFETQMTSRYASIQALLDQVVHYRGKMLRPQLVLLSGLSLSEDLTIKPELIQLSAVMEMVHIATLVHDDVLDEASIRRGAKTFNVLHGNEAAVMLGDCLISRAYQLCSQIGRADISHGVAQASSDVCEGELLQLLTRGDWAEAREVYFDAIAGKTGALTQACCQLAAKLIAPESAAQHQALADYGMALGQAFQIIDDVIDVQSSDETAGKSTGRDQALGKLTMPWICSAENDLAEAQQMWASQSNEQVAEWLREHGGLDGAIQQAQQLVEQALDALDCLADNEAKQVLQDIAQAILHRNK